MPSSPRPHQHPHPCRHVAVSRIAADCGCRTAGKVHLPSRSQERYARLRALGTRLGCLEMLLGGTTTFTDMYYFEDVVPKRPKRRECAACWERPSSVSRCPTTKRPPMRCASPNATWLDLRATADRSRRGAARALYHSDETLKAARALANRFHAPLVIHVAETKKEVDDEMAKRHTTPVGTLDGLASSTAARWRALRLADRSGHGNSEGARCRCGALPFEQHDAGERRGAGATHAGARHPRRLRADGPAGSNNDFNLFEKWT